MPKKKTGSHRVSSRRAFLRTTGGAVAGTALAAGVAARAYAAESNTIRLALIGCGGRGTGAVGDAFACTGGPVKLYAMADLFAPRLEGSLKHLQPRFGDKIDVPPERRFVGLKAYQQAIDALAPGDVALLTTHAAFRPMMFEYAVQKGVNVFMEKSFATDAPATRRLLQAARLSEQKGLKVACGFMWRHSKARQDVVRRIHDGAIGDVHCLRIYRVHGPVHCPPRPADTSELAFQIQRAVSFNWVSSGFFVDWHCHNVDIACWVKNAWPVAAQAMGGRCYPEAGNLFDHYTVEYTFADGAKLFAFARHMHGCWDTYADYAHGTKGSAVIMASLAQPKPCIYKGQQMTPENAVWRYGRDDDSPYHAEWQVLLDAIRQDKPHNEARRAGESNLASLMGRMAAHTGQYVTWDAALKSNFQYVQDIDQMTLDSPAPQPGQTQEI